MTTRLTVFLILALTAVTVAQQQRAPQMDSIRKEDLRADLFFLASDAMKGRLTDTPENRIAAEWIRSRFERLGLAPAGVDGTYYQPYDLMTATLGTGSAVQIVRGPAGERTLAAGTDFYPERFAATATARGPVVFAGYGITAPDINHNDYTDAVKGAIVLVVDHEPGERDPASPFDGVVRAETSGNLRKALAAQDTGAAGILFVADVHNHPNAGGNFDASARGFWPQQKPRIERYTLATWVNRVRIPAAVISPAAAAALIDPALGTLADLARKADTPGGITPVPLAGVEVTMTTAVVRQPVPDRNVLAMIEGSDPQLKNEFVLIGAHYDHDGADGTRIFNGADDDGSGTVGLLEIAEAYALAAREGRRPRRSVLFAAWNSEERGLLGAWAYTEAPTVAPLARIVSNLNLDMIGRNEEVPDAGGGRFNGLEAQTSESNRNAINVIGTTRSGDLKTAADKANAGIGLELKYRYDNNSSNLMRRSDHWPFLQRGVPGVWFLTGLHPDYHTVNDRPERINYEKMEKIVRLVHQLSWDLAQQNGRPKLDLLKQAK